MDGYVIMNNKIESINFKDLISIKEASNYSGFSERHTRLLLEQGKIKGKKLGHDWVTTKDFVNAYLKIKRKPGRKSAKKNLLSP
jgi:hypothetical protein